MKFVPDIPQLVQKYAPGLTLSELQVNAINALTTHVSYINALQAGSGKTLTALLSALYCVEKYNAICIIFSPKSARQAWKKEICRLKQEYAIYSVDEKIPYNSQPFIIVEQSMLFKHIDTISDIKKSGHHLIAVIDEAHVLQNSKSQVAELFAKLKPLFTVRWLLTATPLLNDFQGLYNVLRYVRDDLPPWYAFREKYCVTKERIVRVPDKRNPGQKRDQRIYEILDYKNTQDLSRVISECSIQGGQSYDIEFHYLKTQLDDELKPHYDKASAGLTNLKEDVDEKVFAARLHDIQRTVDGSFGEIGYSKISNKESMLLNTIGSVFADQNDSSIIIYVGYDETIDRLKSLLSHYQCRLGVSLIQSLTGKHSEPERVAKEKAMCPKSVLIISDAGSQSRNLQESNHIIFYTIPWSIGTCIQSIGRICRTDTRHPKQHVYILEVENTIDTYRRLLFEDNVTTINSIFSINPVLPTEVEKLNRRNLAKYRQMFLWNKRK